MKKIILISILGIISFPLYSEEVKVNRSVEKSITKDYDQDGKYSSYEKALRKSQESIYVKLPERRGYWYTMLSRIETEEAELRPDETNRLKKVALKEVK